MNWKEKIKYLFFGVIIASVLWFGYSTHRQVQVNRANIRRIADFINAVTSASQTDGVQNDGK